MPHKYQRINQDLLGTRHKYETLACKFYLTGRRRRSSTDATSMPTSAKRGWRLLINSKCIANASSSTIRRTCALSSLDWEEGGKHPSYMCMGELMPFLLAWTYLECCTWWWKVPSQGYHAVQVRGEEEDKNSLAPWFGSTLGRDLATKGCATEASQMSWIR